MNEGVLQKLKQTMDKRLGTNFWNKLFQKRLFFAEKKIFSDTILKKPKVFNWTNDFIKLKILLNEWFYWTNDFTERTILLNDRSLINRTIFLRMNESFLNDCKNERKSSFTNDEQTKWKKSSACILLMSRDFHEVKRFCGILL